MWTTCEHMLYVLRTMSTRVHPCVHVTLVLPVVCTKGRATRAHGCIGACTRGGEGAQNGTHLGPPRVPSRGSGGQDPRKGATCNNACNREPWVAPLLDPSGDLPGDLLTTGCTYVPPWGPYVHPQGRIRASRRVPGTRRPQGAHGLLGGDT